jgi:hypothetical protein
MARPKNKPCTRPLAAYRLGLLTQTLRMWRGVYIDHHPDYENSAGVRLTYSQLREATIRLAAELPPALYGELRELFAAGERRWSALTSALYEWISGSADLEDTIRCQELPASASGPGATAPDEALDALRAEVDALAKAADDAQSEAVCNDRPGEIVLFAGALNDALGHDPWFALGRAVGAFQAELSELPQGLPDPRLLDELLNAARRLPPEEASRVPALAGIRSDSVGDGETPMRYLTRVTGWLADSLGPPAQGPEAENDPLEYGFLTSTLDWLDGRIQDGLEDAGGLAGAASPEERPRWDKKNFRLMVGSQTVRTLRPLATNVIAVLDAFEREGWPGRINIPPGPGGRPWDWVVRDDTLKSLNEGLARIRFHGDGTGEGIRWDWDGGHRPRRRGG